MRGTVRDLATIKKKTMARFGHLAHMKSNIGFMHPDMFGGQNGAPKR